MNSFDPQIVRITRTPLSWCSARCVHCMSHKPPARPTSWTRPLAAQQQAIHLLPTNWRCSVAGRTKGEQARRARRRRSPVALPPIPKPGRSNIGVRTEIQASSQILQRRGGRHLCHKMTEIPQIDRSGSSFHATGPRRILCPPLRISLATVEDVEETSHHLDSRRGNATVLHGPSTHPPLEYLDLSSDCRPSMRLAMPESAARVASWHVQHDGRQR